MVNGQKVMSDFIRQQRLEGSSWQREQHEQIGRCEHVQGKQTV